MEASRSKAGTGAAAAEELLTTAYPQLAGWINRQVNDDAIAHEIASEAFVRLLSRWTRVESPHTYLHAAATELIRDHQRKNKRKRRRQAATTACAG